MTTPSPINFYAETVAEFTRPGGPFALEEIEVRGIKMQVFAAAPPTMRAVWELAGGYSDRTYVVFEDERYTYAEIAERVRVLAHVLQDEHGVAVGDRVALAMRNYPEWVITYWACVSIGAAVVGMNAWWTGPEMNFGLADSRPKVLICDGERLERVMPELDDVRAAGALHVLAVRSGDQKLPDDASRWDDVIEAVARAGTAPAQLPDATIDPDDDATIFYTSGTTGFPKGAQLTHRGSVHNLFNLAFMNTAFAASMGKARAQSGEVAPAVEDIPPAIMAPTPLFHVTACNCLLHPATLTGAKIVLTYKFDAARALELIERERVTNFSGVPTMSRELLAHPDWNTRDTSSLQGMGGGGAALQPDLVEKIDAALPTGAPSTGYGLTETHGIATANAAQFYMEKPASCGPLVPTLEAKLVDDEGNTLAAGSTGQLCLRGAIIIKGYINRPEATAEAIQDGWFNTGDIARIDEDGFVYIVDRAKDMVLRGGENIYCSEVETAIYKHPAVAEAAVFGVEDERLGEEVAVAVVLAAGAALDAEELRTFLAPMMAKYKIPAYVWFRTEPLPQNANGKFVKRQLREEFSARN